MNIEKNLSSSIRKAYSSGKCVNQRKGVTLSDETKKKVSEGVRHARSLKTLAEASPRFKPWFITDGNVTHLFYDITKEEYAKQCGVLGGTYRDLCTKSKGIYPLKSGKYKGLIIGNIPL